LSYLLACALGCQLNWHQQDLAVFRSRLLVQILAGDFALEKMVIKCSDLTQKLTGAPQVLLVTPRANRKHQMSLSPPANETTSQQPTFGQVLEKHTLKRLKSAPFPVRPTAVSGSHDTLNQTTRALLASTDKLMEWDPSQNEDTVMEMKDAGNTTC
jgi:hypothetical protein